MYVKLESEENKGERKFFVNPTESACLKMESLKLIYHAIRIYPIIRVNCIIVVGVTNTKITMLTNTKIIWLYALCLITIRKKLGMTTNEDFVMIKLFYRKHELACREIKRTFGCFSWDEEWLLSVYYDGDEWKAFQCRPSDFPGQQIFYFIAVFMQCLFLFGWHDSVSIWFNLNAFPFTWIE